ncbi:MAG TPA: hypothetical protein VMK12_03380 [Anaeromyxobacteraceae bacterium]|nr:hypothetical protein [Anaeromyxobacteraceae bacterium]
MEELLREGFVEAQVPPWREVAQEALPALPVEVDELDADAAPRIRVKHHVGYPRPERGAFREWHLDPERQAPRELERTLCEDAAQTEVPGAAKPPN